MDKLRLINNNSGQSLLEAVIALAALILILSASAVAIVTSVNNATFLRNQNQASKLAQEGMEFIRNKKNTSFTNFRTQIANISPRCLDKDLNLALTSTTDCTSGTWPISASANFRFIREVVFIPNDNVECILPDNSGVPGNAEARGTKVRVNVRWSSGKCPSTNLYCHTSYVESCMFPPL